MKKAIGLLTILAAVACNQQKGYQKAEDAQDAGRQFIEASLQGNYEKARFYLLKDSVNLLMLDKQESNYQHLSDKEKKDYQESSIRPIEIKPIDSVTTSYTYYHTSNTKDTTTLRIVKVNDAWLVDLKSILK
ncbi:MAG: hypothetical protein QM731_10185 [Chitinophagaceae bacterium]